MKRIEARGRFLLDTLQVLLDAWVAVEDAKEREKLWPHIEDTIKAAVCTGLTVQVSPPEGE